ncbi:MAG: GNAT family N-acetyltransferase, partial [Deltaproteobacteria bacterium]|nr:GNAT family N-acetyltransferase [Deltaproteobacteria bacterium]
MEDLKAIPKIVFLPPADEPESPMRPEWTLCAFEDGKLATSYAAWPFNMRFNGESVAAAGVTMVGTRPIYRGHGNLRKITKAHFELLREKREQAIALLYASQASIYHRFGYAIVSSFNEYNIEPRYIQFHTEHSASGSFREVGDDELELLSDLYRRFCAERTGYLHRSKIAWKMYLTPPTTPRSLLGKIVYEEAGEPLGYMIYTMEPHTTGNPTEPWQKLVIRDFVWLTALAYREIWNVLAAMNLVRNIVWRAPLDDPLPHLLLEPRMLHSTSYDGLLARIVDIERTIPQRGYDGEGTLIFEIQDELCPWNQGRWKVDATGGKAAIEHCAEDPQLVIPISTMAMLLFNQISATEAARMGRLDVRKPEAL